MLMFRCMVKLEMLQAAKMDLGCLFFVSILMKTFTPHTTGALSKIDK